MVRKTLAVAVATAALAAPVAQAGHERDLT